MPDALTSASAPQDIYRCKICGIESSEATCFAAIATEGPYRLQGTCITCNHPARETAAWRWAVAFIVLVAGPPVYIAATLGTQQIRLMGLIIVAILINPVITILHELVHALTAKVVGLDVTLISIGSGRFLRVAHALGFPVRLYAYPLSGLTYLGGQPKNLIRTRIWLTVLMGPVSNIALLSAVVIFWKPLACVLDTNVMLLWIVFNALMALGNLYPHRFRKGGQLHATDGMQLLQIPFKKRDELVASLSMGLIFPTVVAYNDEDYVEAKEQCLKGLERLPESPWLIGMLSASHICLGDYESGRAAGERLLDLSGKLPSQTYAAIQNNFAVALWLRDFTAPKRDTSLTRADALTADAYNKFPCVLAHRSTRALLLADTNRPEEALELLQYPNYKRGSARDRAGAEFSRAYALRRLNRSEESERALAAGLKLSRKPLPWLTTIGLIP